MPKEIPLISKYDKNKNIWECMTGKEVKQFTHDLKNQIKKLLREEGHWQVKKPDAKSLRDQGKCDFEIKWRKDERESLQIIFNNVELQIKN